MTYKGVDLFLSAAHHLTPVEMQASHNLVHCKPQRKP